MEKFIFPQKIRPWKIKKKGVPVPFVYKPDKDLAKLVNDLRVAILAYRKVTSVPTDFNFWYNNLYNPDTDGVDLEQHYRRQFG